MPQLKTSKSSKSRKPRVRKNSTAKKSRGKTPPFEEYPEWTEARFWSFVRSALRAGFNRWPPKWKVLEAAKRPYKGKNKQQKWEYQCASCSQWVKGKDISVDHVTPAGALSNYDHLVPFVQRLAVGTSKLQALCKSCHKAKTAKERKESKQHGEII